MSHTPCDKMWSCGHVVVYNTIVQVNMVCFQTKKSGTYVPQTTGSKRDIRETLLYSHPPLEVVRVHTAAGRGRRGDGAPAAGVCICVKSLPHRHVIPVFPPVCVSHPTPPPRSCCQLLRPLCPLSANCEVFTSCMTCNLTNTLARLTLPHIHIH